MKLTWLSTAILLMSLNAHATCPPGTQGSTSWNEAVATVKRVLSQNLQNGSHAVEIATDGRPLKIDFDNIGGKVQITLWRSTGGKKFNTNQMQSIAEVCSGDGGVKMEINGTEVNISQLSGGKMSVTAAGYGPYIFAGIAGATEVASDRGNSR